MRQTRLASPGTISLLCKASSETAIYTSEAISCVLDAIGVENSVLTLSSEAILTLPADLRAKVNALGPNSILVFKGDELLSVLTETNEVKNTPCH